MSVLVIGNVVKDVYLNFDEKHTRFEYDEHHSPWLDLAFNGSEQKFFSRNSVFGGAAVTNEVFEKLKIEAVNNDKINTQYAYRYILANNDNVAYLIPSERPKTIFSPPNKPVDWLYVDRSAEITEELVEKIKEYLSLSKSTRIVTFISVCPAGSEKISSKAKKTQISKPVMELMQLSSVIFTDGELSDISAKGVICTISKKSIMCGKNIQQYNLQRQDLTTHLTAYSVIAATIFATMLKGYSTREALMLAKINVEKSRITESLTLEKLTQKLTEYNDRRKSLHLIAKTILADNKGILAADESGGSIHKKFESVGVIDDARHRRDYRNIFFTTENLEKYISGVILFDETARQKSDDGRDFITYLTAKGIVPGIKVDEGLTNFTKDNLAHEKYTKGLKNLPKKLAEYYEMGLRFAKWRAAFEIEFEEKNNQLILKKPTDFAIQKNCEILAKYARECQDFGLVPIVEPEVVYDGFYPIDTCEKITSKVLRYLFLELKKYDVQLDSCILKINMVLAGKQYPYQSTPEEVGIVTSKVLKENCPKELAGVVFLSGGQDMEDTTKNLQAIINYGPYPWPVTFSFARALQESTLATWCGDNSKIEEAREKFRDRLIANCKALIKNKID